MTFRIFSDDARKAIADHIIGAPPAIPNRYGENHGTDLLVQAGDRQPPQYNPKVTGLYLPQGSYAPGQPSSQNTPPSHTPGQTAQIECSGGVPADHSGKCPESMFEKNGKLFAFTRQVDSNGLAYCCPTETPSFNRSDQQVPQTNGKERCPPGFMSSIVLFKRSEQNTPRQEHPYHGKTPQQFVEARSKEIEQAGGTTLLALNTETDVFEFSGCFPIPPDLPLAPPARTPTPPPTETKDYDGDDKNSMPDGPEVSNIVLRGRPIADIAAGSRGFCQLEVNLSFFGPDCKKLNPDPITTSKSTEGLAADCSKANDGNRMFFALNPGAATIEKGTQIVAVRDSVGVSGNVTTATIVVVPCST